MKYCALGKSGMQVSRVSHGCMELGGGPWHVEEKEHNIALLHTALEQGVTLFDTAESYGGGNSERIVGEALKDKRKECLIATKILPQNLHAKDVRNSVKNSLERLQTDYIDLLYIHWPNKEIPLEETLTEFGKLKKEGIIRAIGVSNFSLELMQQAVQIEQIDALQPEYNLLERDIEQGTLAFCEEHQISVFSYNSIAKGILSGAFHFYGAKLSAEDFRNQKPLFQAENMEIEQPLLEILKETAQKRQATISQIATAWILAQPGMSSALIGTQNPKHFVENLQAIDMELSNDEIHQIDKISKDVIAQLKK